MTATAKAPATATITRAEIGSKLDRIRQINIELNEQSAARDAAVSSVIDKYVGPIGTLEKERTEIEESVCIWARENRDREFGQEKTLSFESGASLQFRLKPKSLAFVAGKDEKTVLVALKKGRLSRFIRTTESLNKVLLLAALGTKSLPEKLAKKLGLVSEQKETFAINIPMATAGQEKP